jgi:divalent metal cation (Fe/Co/Zn/Cd) transporter
VIFGEDLAALGGLLLALGFILLAMVTGNPMWDAVGSICIGVLLVLVAVLVGVEVKALLVGQSAEPQVLAAMRAHLVAQPQVAQLYSLITQQLGSEIMVAVKARMQPQWSDVALIEAINAVERELRTAFPQLRWIFFEPDLHD